MDILSYYLESQKSFSWVQKFQSTSNAQKGKTFSYINTNFRSITAFFSQLLMFESKDGLRRSDWHDYQDNGQEKDKHRIINLINAGFLAKSGDIYRITNKGKALLALYRHHDLTDIEKWPLVFLLLLDYSTPERKLDIIFSAMGIYDALEKNGVSAESLLCALKDGLKCQTKEQLFKTDAFWLVTFAHDSEFVKLYTSATPYEKEKLYNWVITQSGNKKSTDCIAHKFVSGGAYSASTFIDDLKVLLSLLILLMLQDRDSGNYIDLYAQMYRMVRVTQVKAFITQYQSAFDSTYAATIQKLNNKIGVNQMEINKRLEDVRVALGFALPGENTQETIDYAWYVGATGNDDNGVYTDFSEQYIAEGRWENRYDDKYIDLVKSMQIGDHIVIKSSYTKKHGLPFDNHGRVVGVMGIKAIGIITENHGDGKNVSVKWVKVDPIKEWYGDGVLRSTIHCIRAADSYIKKALLMFTFENMEQDYSVYEDMDEDDESVAVKDMIESGENRTALPKRNPRKNLTFGLNTILYGAPGTGKTYSTAEYALAIIENRPIDLTQKSVLDRETLMKKYQSYVAENRIVFTTFHQSYGYEDFIQGLRPDTSAGKMEFKSVDGVFKKIADKAMHDPAHEYVLIIDEINRANISKVFGELITLIEEDKRWGEVNAISLTLPSGELFAVPNNLYLIGTMNSADKSISLIDTALRRRFGFIEVTPDYETIADSTLRSVLENLNKGLADELDSTDLLIGHAYFIGKTSAELCEIMNQSIIPLLYEYFYDNAKKVKDQVKKAVDGLSYDIEDKKIGRIKLIKKD
ncbi:MAG: AAA family ATPase [Clostridia bacterium]|nr:AAA family ATPase [Clostridia bacterium]